MSQNIFIQQIKLVPGVIPPIYGIVLMTDAEPAVEFHAALLSSIDDEDCPTFLK